MYDDVRIIPEWVKHLAEGGNDVRFIHHDHQDAHLVAQNRFYLPKDSGDPHPRAIEIGEAAASFSDD